MKRLVCLVAMVAFLVWSAGTAAAAYHHEGEKDSGNFLNVYPDKKGTKLDHCALCHKGGSYTKKSGKKVHLGSCQWCHRTYGYDGSGNIVETINQYGMHYFTHGRSEAAIRAIENLDSDGDGHDNKTEIEATRFPGNASDYPGLKEAPYRIYTKAQLEALGRHTQFLLMNTSRSGDFYAKYSGIPVKTLLDDAGILPSATGIRVYAPDGWSQDHLLEYDSDPEMYHVYGNMPGKDYQYPPASYFYKLEADKDKNTKYGWCDYSAPSCAGRSNGDAINVPGGLKAILAYSREDASLETGVLNSENKLVGEGPFRLVVPQKSINPPDQSSKASFQPLEWAYNEDWDHNAGSCTRSATIIKVEPLPAGTTDIDTMEMGWKFVDQEKIIVYGAIDGTDSNGNGVLDSEEMVDPDADFDNDGTPDYKDNDTARVRHAKGKGTILIHTSAGSLSGVAALNEDDGSLNQTGRPEKEFPYGAVRFRIVGLSSGATVKCTLVFPDEVVASAEYYMIDNDGWRRIEAEDNDGDKILELTLKDGDPETDADGKADGVITDPGALAVPSLSGTGTAGEESGSSSSSGCFIGTLR